MTLVEQLYLWNVVQFIIILLLLKLAYWQWMKARNKRKIMKQHIDGMQALAYGVGKVNKKL